MLNIIVCYPDLNECLSSPCKNGGICFNYNGSYACVCKPGYQGPRCSLGKCEDMDNELLLTSSFNL